MTRPRNRFVAFLRDSLLVPIAVLIVLVEDVLWAGALAVLRGMRELALVRVMRERMAGLPAPIALPLFLVPEIVSHLAGAYATLLLAQGRFASALVVGGLVKGACTLLLVWIYQCCEETLMRIAWFAWLHHTALAARDWALARVAPIRARMRARLAPLLTVLGAWLAVLRAAMGHRRFYPRARLRAWRAWLSVRLADRVAAWVASCRRR